MNPSDVIWAVLVSVIAVAVGITVPAMWAHAGF